MKSADCDRHQNVEKHVEQMPTNRRREKIVNKFAGIHRWLADHWDNLYENICAIYLIDSKLISRN